MNTTRRFMLYCFLLALFITVNFFRVNTRYEK